MLTALGNTFNVGGGQITYGVVVMVVLYAIVATILGRTAWGRHVYAVGDDAESARLAGIRVQRVLLSVYLAAGVILAIGAWVLIGRVDGLDGVSLELYPGEVLAIIGDNGAGKSTLVKCLTGAEIPDEGEIFLDGQPIHFKRPQDARAAGIETVYQNLAVSPALDVASNLFLGRELRRAGVLGSVFRIMDTKKMRKQAKNE